MFPDPARRRLLLGMLATLLPAPAAARQNRPICPSSPVLSDLTAPLTIDVHAHVFNGSDLQIKEFLSQTVVGHDEALLYQLARGLGGILQFLVWNNAPSASDEMRALDRYARQLQECGDLRQVRAIASAAFQEGYQRGRAELQTANTRANPRGGGPLVLGPGGDAAAPGLAGEIEKLPETFDEFEEQAAQAPPLLGSQPHLRGYIQFVVHNFNHRHVNALDYLTTYSNQSARKVDLVVPSLVDYDWWLAKGKKSRTPLEQQVDVMARIAVLLAGRVHGFAPFCPFREAMTLRGGSGDSLRLVKRAVQTQGFLGVKLYPPMGFAAWGNAELNVWQGKRTLHADAAKPDFGKRLDTSMRRLFAWCQAEDVPIMAHANQSNGPYDEFKRLAASEYWERALDTFPGLRVSFGHFGDTDLEDHEGERSISYLGLMTPGTSSGGAHVFSDSSYFAGVLGNPQGMAAVLLKLYQSTPPTVIAERLMYGTDWMMVLPQRNVERYLAEFIGVMTQLESKLPGQGKGAADAFFGGNAVQFLGLRRGNRPRQRLEAFYAKHQVATPDWMTKVDRAS